MINSLKIMLMGLLVLSALLFKRPYASGSRVVLNLTIFSSNGFFSKGIILNID